MKKTNRILAVLLAILLTLGIAPMTTVATDDAAIRVVKSGDSDTFAKDAPITTVRIDRTMLSVDNLELWHPDKSAGFRVDDNGYVYAERCRVRYNYSGLSFFTMTFPNAAVLPDGTRKALVIKFDEVHTIGSPEHSDNWYETLFFARVTGNPNNPISFAPLSTMQQHLALRSDVKIYVDMANSDDSVLFAARSINTSRVGSANFQKILHAEKHWAYSESVELVSGVTDGSDVYIPEESLVNVVDGMVPGGYQIRFVGAGGTTGNYTDGFATACSAAGLSARVWSSAGANTVPTEIYFCTEVSSYMLETAAGSNGHITLWADGKADSADAKMLAGGTAEVPLSYIVPNGKPVTIKITPDTGCVLDTLTVNGQQIVPTEHYGADGKTVDHYTYTVPGDVLSQLTDTLPDGTKKCAVSATFHVHSQSTKRENETPATCTTDGSYDAVVFCTDCGAEISRQKVTVPAAGHKYVDHAAQAATCTAVGWDAYQTCEHCDYTSYKEIPANGHSYGENEYHWADDNATCTASCHCTVSGCDHAITETAKAAREQTKAPTCTGTGEYTYTAAFNNKRFYTQTTTAEIPAKGHTPAQAVRENEIAPTCTEAGSYEEVVCCADCGEELSRRTVKVPALGHEDADHNGKCDRCGEKTRGVGDVLSAIANVFRQVMKRVGNFIMDFFAAILVYLAILIGG